jgi:hypothetical protein
VARRFDGRPVSEHVTERRLTTRAILDQEAAILRWARQAVAVPAGSTVVLDECPVWLLPTISPARPPGRSRFWRLVSVGDP